MLQQINLFMRQSTDMLEKADKLQEEERKRKDAEQEVSEQEQQELDSFAQHEAEWENGASGPDPKELQGAPLDY